MGGGGGREGRGGKEGWEREGEEGGGGNERVGEGGTKGGSNIVELSITPVVHTSIARMTGTSVWSRASASVLTWLDTDG